MKAQNLQQQKNMLLKAVYLPKDEIKFLTNSLEQNLCDYSDAYILVTENITVRGGNANTNVAFKNCAPFRNCRTEINDTFVDDVANTNIPMPMYNLIEYSDSYSDSSGSLWQFKRDELNDNDINTVSTKINPSLFKYKARISGDIGADGRKNGVKIAVPLKYLSNFWISLEMPFNNCKVELSLDWYTIVIGGTAATFVITDTKCYVLVVTLKTEDYAKLLKLLNEGLKDQFIGINTK